MVWVQVMLAGAASASQISGLHSPRFLSLEKHEGSSVLIENGGTRLITFFAFCLLQLGNPKAMLGGSLVTTAWCVLRLRMEGTPSRYGG
jgi:hypothetical protein